MTQMAPSAKVAVSRRLPNVDFVEAAPAKVKGPSSVQKLRASITPGTILILLAGEFRGKRVVFLQQLPSGLLLVTGPRKINGVPLHRINQAFVIATSSSIDISSFALPAAVNEKLFKKAKSAKESSKDILAEDNATTKKAPLSPELKAAQGEVDAQLLPIIKAVPHMKSYIASIFSLQKGQAPHNMKF